VDREPEQTELTGILREALKAEPGCEFVLGGDDRAAMEGEFNLTSVARFLLSRGVVIDQMPRTP